MYCTLFIFYIYIRVTCNMKKLCQCFDVNFNSSGNVREKEYPVLFDKQDLVSSFLVTNHFQ